MRIILVRGQIYYIGVKFNMGVKFITSGVKFLNRGQIYYIGGLIYYIVGLIFLKYRNVSQGTKTNLI